ncbi:Receptor-like protein 12 [Cucumis melo var. makuwa]|uniref:Receptor-like protein 12 n=1 Tax=Cucumis melo var. makuwa TaxID=1194695 RepID=A0A5D3BLH7_CUCMM|nr:Receptor-like protein 12 [Cucumis melo var. makuwa]TYK00671.1 Receptor-like protein 12 [Cucumis melo var. makuwa]
MPNSKLVRKVLRSLASKFNMKVPTIEEANDLSKMKLDELFGSLRTFELHLGEGKSKRKTGIALTSVKEEVIEESKVSSRYSNSTHYPRTSSSFSSSGLYRRKDYEWGEKDYGTLKVEKNSKGIRCHECEEFEHIQSECTTYLKRKKKSLVATLSDEENYSESNNEEVGKALISSITTNEGVENVISQVLDQQATMSNKSPNESTLKRKWEEDQATILQSLLYQRQVSNQSKRINRRRTEWRPKVNMKNCKVALTPVHNPNSTDQYADSGCSRHMTGNASLFFELSKYNYLSVHTMVVTRVKSYQSTAFTLVHLSFALFESSYMTPIDVGTTSLVICLSMRLFQDSHIPDVFAEFDTASDESKASSAVSPTIGQPLVLSAVCV